MSNFTDFIRITEGMPPMPKNVGSAVRRQSGNFPAESLVTSDDFSTGDCYRLPNNVGLSGTGAVTGTELKRFDKTNTAVWTEDPFTVLDTDATLDADDWLGCSMNSSGELVTMIADLGAANTTIAFSVYNKTTGATTTLTKENSGGSNNVWPGTSFTDATSSELGVTNFDFYSTLTYSDLTRTHFEVLDNGNYLFIGARADSAKSSEVNRESCIVEINSSTGAIVSQAALTFGDGTTSVNSQVQYRSKDGNILLGSIFSDRDPWTGEFRGRFALLIRGNTTKMIRIPDDPERFFSINRNEESPFTGFALSWMVDRGMLGTNTNNLGIEAATGLLSAVEEPNPWFNARGEQIQAASHQARKAGLRLWPEPIKIWTMNDHIVIDACPVPNPASTLSRTIMEGSTFMLRSEFDTWLSDVADFYGLGT